jgi:hypothetical protein
MDVRQLCYYSAPYRSWEARSFEYGYRIYKFGRDKIPTFESGTCHAKLMTLSFPPGDLHLTKSQSGLFVVRIAGRDILFTKSQRQALAKFNALKLELEKKLSTPR